MRHLKLIPTLTLFLILTACTSPVTYPATNPPAATYLPARLAQSSISPHVSTFTPTAQPSATAAASATPRPTGGNPTPRPPAAVTPTPVQPTQTPTAPPPSATPAGPQLVLAANANIRCGPGTAYPVIGGAQHGRQFAITGRNGVTDPAVFATAGWWQVALPGGGRGWIWAGLGTANVAPDRVAEAPYDPPPPTATATPLPPTTISAPPPAPAGPEVVVLGPDTVYPVRARRFVGAGYEFVDASSQYDLVLHRDVFGAVAHQFWGDRLYGKHPAGIRITLIDPEAPPECAIVCKSCLGQPSIARHLAPIRLSNDWRGDCHARSLSASYGDGQGGAIWVGCAYDSDDALGIQMDPEQCFVTIAAPGPHLTDLLVSATITTFNWLVVQNYGAMTPDFTQELFTPHLGQARKEGEQWRWEAPFLEVRPAGGL